MPTLTEAPTSDHVRSALMRCDQELPIIADGVDGLVADVFGSALGDDQARKDYVIALDLGNLEQARPAIEAMLYIAKYFPSSVFLHDRMAYFVAAARIADIGATRRIIEGLGVQSDQAVVYARALMKPFRKR